MNCISDFYQFSITLCNFFFLLIFRQPGTSITSPHSQKTSVLCILQLSRQLEQQYKLFEVFTSHLTDQIRNCSHQSRRKTAKTLCWKVPKLFLNEEKRSAVWWCIIDSNVLFTFSNRQHLIKLCQDEEVLRNKYYTDLELIAQKIRSIPLTTEVSQSLLLGFGPLKIDVYFTD